MEENQGVRSIAAKFESFGWSVDEIDGHDMHAIVNAMATAQESARPHMIVARTRKGKGVRFMETTPYWHLGFLGPADKAMAIAEIQERLDA